MNNGAQTVSGVVDIVNGIGNHIVGIATADAADTVSVGALFVHNGFHDTGANLLVIGASIGRRFSSSGSVVYVDHPATTANTLVSFTALASSFIGGDVFIATANGTDTIVVENTRIDGHLIAITGGLDDQLRLQMSTAIGGNIVFNGGDGNNTFIATNNVLVFGVIDIHNGSGAHNIRVGVGADDQVKVFGGLFLHNGPNTTGSANNFELGAAGGGNHLVRIAGPVLYVDFGVHTASSVINVQGPTELASFFEVFTGAGPDQFSTIAALTVQGHLLVVTGDGDDTVLVNGRYGSSVLVDVGLGRDLLHIGTNLGGTPVVSTIQGPVRVFLGDGVNTLRINDTTFSSSFAFFGGSGVDTVEIEKPDSGSRTSFDGPVTGILGDSDDTVDVGRNSDGNDGAGFHALFLDGGPGILDRLFIGSNVAGTGAVRPGNFATNIALVTVVGFEDVNTP